MKYWEVIGNRDQTDALLRDNINVRTYPNWEVSSRSGESDPYGHVSPEIITRVGDIHISDIIKPEWISISDASEEWIPMKFIKEITREDYISRAGEQHSGDVVRHGDSHPPPEKPEKPDSRASIAGLSATDGRQDGQRSLLGNALLMPDTVLHHKKEKHQRLTMMLEGNNANVQTSPVWQINDAYDAIDRLHREIVLMHRSDGQHSLLGEALLMPDTDLAHKKEKHQRLTMMLEGSNQNVLTSPDWQKNMGEDAIYRLHHEIEEQQPGWLTSALPPGWQSARDTGGATYYINTVTNVTQWEKPEPEL